MTIDEIKKDIRDMLNDVTEIDTDAVGDDDLLFDDVGLTILWAHPAPFTVCSLPFYGYKGS